MIRRLLRAIARRRIKTCPRCFGTGTEVIDVDRDGLVYVDACIRCLGTGRV